MRKTSAQEHSRGVIVILEYIINYILKQLEEAKGLFTWRWGTPVR